MNETRYIGEVGLDSGPRYFRSVDLQKQVFERILKQCAKARDKILTVHSVRAAKTVLDLVEGQLPPSQGKVALHWFTGSKSDTRRAVELGCYFSVNAAMLSTEKGRTLVAGFPIDRLLTETDGPFTNINSNPSRPTDVGAAIEKLAMVRMMSPNALADVVIANLRVLVGAAGDPLTT